MICPRCGFESQERAKFCSECGLQLRAARPDEGTIAFPGGLGVGAGASIPAPPGEALPADPSAKPVAGVQSPGSPAAPPAGATSLASPTTGDDGATVLGVAPGLTVLGGATPPDSRRPGPPLDDGTRLVSDPAGLGVAPTLATPPPDDGTRLASDAGLLQGATVLGAPLPDATRLGLATPPAVSRPTTPPPDDGTRLASDGGIAGGATVLGTPAPQAGRLTTRSRGGKRRVVADGDSGPLEVGQQFGRYVIIRLLGLGGMGAVYQAWDEELEVAVAVKVIRPEVTADPSAAQELERRFKRELLLARQVTHKNVVRIHDLGELEGIKYITMSYVHGTDLATILQRHGHLPVPQALKIMRGVVSGLVAAHEAGVVHRDLKPANIMVEEASDDPLIMDFGIARSATGAVAREGQPGGGADFLSKTPSALTDATMAGAVVGTIGYMAPEQARAQEVDQRADIYSLGLIFYDTLLGPKRFESGLRPIEELKQRLEQAPPSPRSVDPMVPEPVDEIVARCLAPDPAARFQTTAELGTALARLDDAGYPLPVFRRLTPRMVAAAGVVGVSLLGLASWAGWSAYQQRLAAAAAAHEPVSVVIADFQNRTNEPVFDRTLEPIVKVALEGSGFISAYDRAGIWRGFGVRPPEKLDERAAQEIALKQGVGVVLSGSLERRGAGYAISVKAAQAVSGTVITTATEAASGRDGVVGVTTELAASVRRALGDTTSSDSAQRFAMDTLSATSLEAVRAYAAGMVAISDSKFDQAREHFSQAVKQDPNFGMGWTALAMASYNLDRRQDTEKYVKEAFRHLDTMTERERYRTRGLYYMATNDYQQCVKEYGDLVAKFKADVSARNNLALCMTNLRDMPGAVEQMRNVVKILPNRALYRVNLALYASYAGDFQTAEQEARALKEPGVFGLLALAFAQLGQGQMAQAAETYRAIGKIDAQGLSYMASGFADIALHQGRFSEAATVLAPAAAADVEAQEPDRAAAKFAVLAQARLLQRQKGPAVAAAESALANSQTVKIRFLAARVFAEAGEVAKARALAAELAKEFQAEPQAYAKIIEGDIALASGNAREAVKPLTEATALLDTWIGRFDLGRAYFEAGAFTQADSEFDRCLKRRGEALSLFLDEEPTYGYLPLAYYYQGRVREELGTSGFADSYRAYLGMRGGSSEDPLVPEVRRRAGR